MCGDSDCDKMHGIILDNNSMKAKGLNCGLYDEYEGSYLPLEKVTEPVVWIGFEWV